MSGGLVQTHQAPGTAFGVDPVRREANQERAHRSREGGPMRVAFTMIRFPALAIALFGCGAEGGGGAQPRAGERGSNEAAADRTGSARVTLGEATFQFEVECMYGTVWARGAGEREDGTPAHISASFDPEEPEGADVRLRVGTDRVGGPADERWVAGNYGHSAGVTWEGDSHSVRASAPFRELESGDRTEHLGVLEITCPEG